VEHIANLKRHYKIPIKEACSTTSAELMGIYFLNNLHFMTHSIFNSDLNTEIIIDETLCENVCISIHNHESCSSETHYLKPKELDDLIITLLHIQNKKSKAI